MSCLDFTKFIRRYFRSYVCNFDNLKSLILRKMSSDKPCFLGVLKPFFIVFDEHFISEVLDHVLLSLNTLITF